MSAFRFFDEHIESFENEYLMGTDFIIINASTLAKLLDITNPQEDEVYAKLVYFTQMFISKFSSGTISPNYIHTIILRVISYMFSLYGEPGNQLFLRYILLLHIDHHHDFTILGTLNSHNTSYISNILRRTDQLIVNKNKGYDFVFLAKRRNNGVGPMDIDDIVGFMEVDAGKMKHFKSNFGTIVLNTIISIRNTKKVGESLFALYAYCITFFNQTYGLLELSSSYLNLPGLCLYSKYGFLRLELHDLQINKTQLFAPETYFDELNLIMYLPPVQNPEERREQIFRIFHKNTSTEQQYPYKNICSFRVDEKDVVNNQKKFLWYVFKYLLDIADKKKYKISHYLKKLESYHIIATNLPDVFQTEEQVNLLKENKLRDFVRVLEKWIEELENDMANITRNGPSSSSSSSVFDKIFKSNVPHVISKSSIKKMKLTKDEFFHDPKIVELYKMFMEKNDEEKEYEEYVSKTRKLSLSVKKNLVPSIINHLNDPLNQVSQKEIPEISDENVRTDVSELTLHLDELNQHLPFNIDIRPLTLSKTERLNDIFSQVIKNRLHELMKKDTDIIDDETEEEDNDEEEMDALDESIINTVIQNNVENPSIEEEEEEEDEDEDEEEFISDDFRHFTQEEIDYFTDMVQGNLTRKKKRSRNQTPKFTTRKKRHFPNPHNEN